MNAKIGWYREVLELEPDSRLFLPLASLLVEEGELEEACQVLATGLKRHPGFLEARLAYVDVLRRLNRAAETETEIRTLTPVFARHENFWQAWASSTAGAGQLDTSLVLRCMALVSRGVQLDFGDLLRRGLESLEAELAGHPLEARTASRTQVPQAPQASRAVQAAAVEPEPVSEPVRPAPAAAALAAAAALQAEDRAGDSEEDEENEVRKAAVLLSEASMYLEHAGKDEASQHALAAAAQAGQELEAAGDEDDDASEIAVWPPRTRSMAEVLVEQGNYAEALSIYGELVQKAADPALRSELEARMKAIRALSHGEQEAGDESSAGGTPVEGDIVELSEAADETADKVAGSTAPGHPVAAVSAPDEGVTFAAADPALLTVLESLAERVEARIR